MGHRLLSETSYGQRQPQNAVQHDIQELTEREAELADPYQPRRPGRNQRLRWSASRLPTGHSRSCMLVESCWAIGFSMHTWLCQQGHMRPQATAFLVELENWTAGSIEFKASRQAWRIYTSSRMHCKQISLYGSLSQRLQSRSTENCHSQVSACQHWKIGTIGFYRSKYQNRFSIIISTRRME